MRSWVQGRAKIENATECISRTSIFQKKFWGSMLLDPPKEGGADHASPYSQPPLLFSTFLAS